MANPIRKLVQLVLDRRAAAKTEADAKKALGGVKKALGGLKATALKVGAAMAAAFGVRALIRFGKESVKVAAEADAIWTRLGHAVENVGVSFADAKPEIDAFARAMQDVTTVGDEDFAATLTELITISGDYEKSLENVGVVADLAAAKQIDLRTAAQLVGRAMIGETSTLKRYGVIVEEGADAMVVLRKQFRGFAESEAESVQGQLKQLNNEWGDFQQAIGDAIIAGAEGESMLDRLTLGIKNLTETLNIWNDTVNGISQTFRAGKGLISKVLFGSETPEEAVARLKTIRALTVTELAGVVRDMESLQAPIKKFWDFFYGVTPGRTANLEFAQEELDGLRMTLDAIDRAIADIESGATTVGRPVSPGPTTPTAETGTGDDPTEEAQTLLGIWDQYPAVMLEINNQLTARQEMTDQLAATQAGLNTEMEMSAENAEKWEAAMAKAGEAAKAGQEETKAMGLAADAAGTLIAGALGGNVGQLARWKAEQNAIMAAEQLAMGLVATLTPGLQATAGGHFAAAAQFGAISAAWGALAGATGGFSGGGGGGGGGGRGSPSDTGGAASERAAVAGEEVHIYFVGPGFSAVNPEVQRIVYGAQQEAQERYGPNATVKLHRRAR